MRVPGVFSLLLRGLSKNGWKQSKGGGPGFVWREDRERAERPKAEKSLRQYRTNEVVDRQVDFASGVPADSDVLLEVNREICRKWMAQKTCRVRRRIVRWCLNTPTGNPLGKGVCLKSPGSFPSRFDNPSGQKNRGGEGTES